MKRTIEFDLPISPREYEEIRFIVRTRDDYNVNQTADKLAELLECLNNYVPNAVMEKLRRDPRTISFRNRL